MKHSEKPVHTTEKLILLGVVGQDERAGVFLDVHYVCTACMQQYIRLFMHMFHQRQQTETSMGERIELEKPHHRKSDGSFYFEKFIGHFGASSGVHLTSDEILASVNAKTGKVGTLEWDGAHLWFVEQDGDKQP